MKIIMKVVATMFIFSLVTLFFVGLIRLVIGYSFFPNDTGVNLMKNIVNIEGYILFLIKEFVIVPLLIWILLFFGESPSIISLIRFIVVPLATLSILILENTFSIITTIIVFSFFIFDPEFNLPELKFLRFIFSKKEGEDNY